MKHLSRVLAVSLGAALLVPAVALAATPKAGHFSQTKGNRLLVGFDVFKDRKTVRNFTNYNKCVKVPLQMPRIKISRGSFSFSGSAKDVLGKSFKVTVKGKFTTATKASGTVRYTTQGCDSGTIRFTRAVRTGAPGSG